MKRTLCLLLALMCAVAVSCADNRKTAGDFGNENGFLENNAVSGKYETSDSGLFGNYGKENSDANADIPGTEQNGEHFLPVMMFMADGHLWYDTGEDSKMTPRCGTLDGNFESTCGEFEVPKKNGTANFKAKDPTYFGWQNATNDTKEVNTGTGWRIFRRVGLLHNDIEEFAGCVRAEGDNERIILAVNNIEKDAQGKPVYTASDKNAKDHDLEFSVKYGCAYDWGVVMSAENITHSGMTLKIKTDKTELENPLGTGSAYELDVYNGKFWERVPYNTSYENIAWDAVMYIIAGDTYSDDINWEWLYGELPAGKYRISKQITDNNPGKSIWHEFYLEFEIKDELCSYPLAESVCPYALMHDGVMYYYTGEYIFDDVEYSEKDILGKVTSTVPETRMPYVDGQANIDIEGSIFMKHELAGDGLLALIDGKWYIFETREDK